MSDSHDSAILTFGEVNLFAACSLPTKKKSLAVAAQCNGTLGEKKVFTGNEAHQITPEQYYGSGGRLKVVTDKDTAHAAINEIIVQGEGHGSDIWDDVEDDKALMGPRDQVRIFTASMRFARVVSTRRAMYRGTPVETNSLLIGRQSGQLQSTLNQQTSRNGPKFAPSWMNLIDFTPPC